MIIVGVFIQNRQVVINFINNQFICVLLQSFQKLEFLYLLLSKNMKCCFIAMLFVILEMTEF